MFRFIFKRPIFLSLTGVISGTIYFAVLYLFYKFCYSFGFFVYLLLFIIITGAFVFVFHYLNHLHLNNLFQLTRRKNNQLVLNMRSIGFIATVCKMNKSKEAVAKEFLTQFIKAAKLAAHKFPEEQVIFLSETWLITNNRINRLRKAGFKINKI